MLSVIKQDDVQDAPGPGVASKHGVNVEFDTLVCTPQAPVLTTDDPTACAAAKTPSSSVEKLALQKSHASFRIDGAASHKVARTPSAWFVNEHAHTLVRQPGGRLAKLNWTISCIHATGI